MRFWKPKMLSENYFEILSKPQYTYTDNKYLCVLLNGCVVLKFAPVAVVSTSGLYPDPVPKDIFVETCNVPSARVPVFSPKITFHAMNILWDTMTLIKALFSSA